jgi:endonuclease G
LDLPPSFEEIIIGRDEKVLISFLRNGLEAAKSVARIIVPRTIGGQVSGTGWLVTPDLLLTCYHVVEARRQGQEPPTTSQELEQQAKASILWFGYEVGAYTEYRCIDLAHSCKALDYALLRIAQTSVNGVSLSDWGILKLARIQPNLLRGTRLNVIQHPGGRVKEIALRTNFYIGSVAESSRLHYLSDTEKGSSGSPVLDDTWQAVALHRAWDYYDRYYEGQPVIRFSSLGLQYAGLNEFSGQAVATINEGVLIHSILDDLPGSVREEIEHAQQW